MANPYKPTVVVAKRRESAPAPTLDLDPTTGPEHKQDLPTAPASGDTVPDGSIKEILTWVGDDKDRAKQAADAEKKSDNPRPTLLDKLKKVGDE